MFADELGLYIFGQSKTFQVRGKKSVNEGEGTCEEYASTSEQKQNEKQSEDFSGQPDIHSHEHVSSLLLL